VNGVGAQGRADGAFLNGLYACRQRAGFKEVGEIDSFAFEQGAGGL
jgi:hypothetical protein